METHSGKRKAPRPLCLRVRHTPCWTAACWQSPVDLCTERKRLQRNALAFKSSSNRQMTWVPRAGWGEMPREEPQIEQLLGGGDKMLQNIKKKSPQTPHCAFMQFNGKVCTGGRQRRTGSCKASRVLEKGLSSLSSNPALV